MRVCTVGVLITYFMQNSNCVYFCIPNTFIGKNITVGIGNYNYRCKYSVFSYYLVAHESYFYYCLEYT